MESYHSGAGGVVSGDHSHHHLLQHHHHDNPTQKWQKVKGYVKYRTSYNKAWEKTFGFIARSSVSDQHIFCTVCQKHVSIAHQGSCDIKRHARGQQHLRRMAMLAHHAAQGIPFLHYNVEEKLKEPLVVTHYTQPQ
ncbi:hypothetical protein Pcinc_013204, partial [Petrolisthes cinctipes]